MVEKSFDELFAEIMSREVVVEDRKVEKLKRSKGMYKKLKDMPNKRKR